MRISPIQSGVVQPEKLIAVNDYIPTTVRHNSLSDMEFSIIADKIRAQNLKNQMNVRLMNLKHKLGSFMAKDLYTGLNQNA